MSARSPRPRRTARKETSAPSPSRCVFGSRPAMSNQSVPPHYSRQAAASGRRRTLSPRRAHQIYDQSLKPPQPHHPSNAADSVIGHMNGIHIYRCTPFPLQGANAAWHAPTPKRERELGTFFTQIRFPVCDLRLGGGASVADVRVGGVLLSGGPGDPAGSKVDRFEPLSVAGLRHPVINDVDRSRETTSVPVETAPAVKTSSRTGEVGGMTASS